MPLLNIKRSKKLIKPRTSISNISKEVSTMIVIFLTQEQYLEFLHDEIEEIKKHKWIESEKAQKDLGDDACFDWIDHFVDDFKKDWIKNHFGIIEECVISIK